MPRATFDLKKHFALSVLIKISIRELHIRIQISDFLAVRVVLLDP